MVLAREAVRPDGSKIQQRMVFKNIGRNEFDWSGSGLSTVGKHGKCCGRLTTSVRANDQSSSLTSSHEWDIRRLLVQRRCYASYHRPPDDLRGFSPGSGFAPGARPWLRSS